MSNRPPNDPILPQSPDTPYAASLNYRLKDLMRTVCTRLNALADGKLSAIDNAATSIPTVGTYAVGDFVRNSAPAELGGAGSKYCIFGWICVTAGTPGTFVQVRTLTGN